MRATNRKLLRRLKTKEGFVTLELVSTVEWENFKALDYGKASTLCLKSLNDELMMRKCALLWIISGIASQCIHHLTDRGYLSVAGIQNGMSVHLFPGTLAQLYSSRYSGGRATLASNFQRPYG
jgi:hypothetical protein